MPRTKNQTIESVEDNTDLSMVSEIQTVELITEIAVGKLTSNAKEYKAAIEKELETFSIEKYLNNPDAAKSDKAYLNKLKEEVADKRKKATALWNSPLAEFENEMKTLEKTINEASNQLKQIVDQAAQKEKDDKRAEIEEIWNTINYDVVSLDKVFNPKWLNKTCKIKEITEELVAIVDKIKTELQTLNSMDDEDKTILQSFYLDCLDLNATLQKGNQLKANRAALKAAEEKKLAEEQRKEEKNNEKVEEPIKEDVKVFQENEMIQEYTLKIRGPRYKLLMLKQFIDNSGLEYTKL